VVTSCPHYNNFGIWLFGCDTVSFSKQLPPSQMYLLLLSSGYTSQIQIYTTLEKSNLCRMELRVHKRTGSTLKFDGLLFSQGKLFSYSYYAK